MGGGPQAPSLGRLKGEGPGRGDIEIPPPWCFSGGDARQWRASIADRGEAETKGAPFGTKRGPLGSGPPARR